MTVHADFDAAFTAGARFVDSDGDELVARIVEVGVLSLRTGRIAIGDPLTGLLAMSGPGGPLPSGDFAVEVAVVGYPNGDARVAAARVRFADRPAKRWLGAEHGAGVDSGTAGFADADDIEAVAGRSDAIMTALAERYVDTYSLAVVDAGGGKLAAFSSGIGDGRYAAWWGLDADGAPVALCLDFDLLTEPETEDVELPLPVYGVVDDPVLAKHGVKARVLWTALGRVDVSYEPPLYVLARWKLPDGKLARLAGEPRGRGRTRFVLDHAPSGASLLLRVAVGTRRLRQA
jgi:hypothetical protein